ncbi:hypothetical protein [Ollibium composti]|uniref:Oligosaccharide repeat unit polymerase n=1 Tax=Ollibium composti TaxID=2675109 RepID=A0ABY2Q3P1_9HYPH|nr:hypothetical protein [Mesorhizobium composti]THF54758.1 hypothetical protein E6C48_21020 [Mesorhizobium composti]
MIVRDPLRLWIAKNIHLLMFLGIYFATVVAGNLLYASPWGHAILDRINYPTEFLAFDYVFTAGFWLLLLCPFAIAPLVVTLVKRFAERPMAAISSALPEFRRIDYLVIAGALFVYLAYSFYTADAISLMMRGTDDASAVNARFELRSRIGFPALAILQSLLVYLSIYALVRALRSGEWFWRGASVVSIGGVATFLLLLNMKWPIVLFFGSLVLAFFIYGRKTRIVYVVFAMGTAGVVLAYLVVSMFIFRTGLVSDGETRASYFMRIAQTSLQFAPDLALAAVNRMAVSYPYYYETFTEDGQVCGGLLEQARRGPVCRPSTYIYTRIFGDDGWRGTGTSPAAVHISGYAIGGWPLAFVGIVLASVVLGLFASLPIDKSATVGATVIVGALAGYHFSQIPGEGVFIYDHGLLWAFLMVVAYALWRWSQSKIRLPA